MFFQPVVRFLLTSQNEISLKEDEIITQIEEIDDGTSFILFQVIADP